MGSLPTQEQEGDNRHHDISTVLGVSTLPQSELSEQPLTLSAVVQILEAVRTAVRQKAHLHIGIAGVSRVGGGKVTVSHALGGGHGVCSRVSGSRDVIEQRASRLRLLVSATLEALVNPHSSSSCNASVEPIDYDPSTNPRYHKVFSTVSGMLEIENPDVFFLKRFCPRNQLRKIIIAGESSQELVDYVIWEISNLIYDAMLKPPRHFASHPSEQEFATVTQKLLEMILCRLVDAAVQEIDKGGIHTREAIGQFASTSFTAIDQNEYDVFINGRQRERAINPNVEIPTIDEFKYSQFLRKLIPHVFGIAPEVIGLLNFSDDEVLRKFAEQLRRFIPTDELALYSGMDFAFYPLSSGCGICTGKKDAPYDLTSGSKLSTGVDCKANEIFVGDDGYKSLLDKFWFYVHPIDTASRLMMAHVFNRNLKRIESLGTQGNMLRSETMLHCNDPIWTASEFLYSDGIRSFEGVSPDVVTGLSDGMCGDLSNIVRYVIDRHVGALNHLAASTQYSTYCSDRDGDVLFDFARSMSSCAIESCSHIPHDWNGKNSDLWQRVCEISRKTQSPFRNRVLEYRTNARFYIRYIIQEVLHLRRRIADDVLTGYVDQHGEFRSPYESGRMCAPTACHLDGVLAEISPEKLRRAEKERQLDPHSSRRRGRNVAKRVRRAKRVLRLYNACRAFDPQSLKSVDFASDRVAAAILSFIISEKLDQADETLSLDPNVPGNDEKILNAVRFILMVLRDNILIPVMDSFKKMSSEQDVQI